MKTLKIVLFSIYPILILLLVMANLKSCHSSKLDNIESPTEIPLDTANIVRNAERIGKTGDLKVTLLWNFQGDIDLHVKQPNGVEIFFENKQDSSTGGYLDTDNQNGGYGSAENIYWENPPKGEYSVSLVYFKESRATKIAETGDCSIVVFQQGKVPKTYKVRMSTVKESKHITNIVIQ